MSIETAPVVTGAARSEGALLTVEDLHVYYGNIAAVKGLAMAVRKGEIVTLIGSNGAGKSTSLRTISGLLHARKGRVVFDGRDISRAAGHHIVSWGICHSPEGRRIFPRMSVEENLDLGAFLRKDRDAIDADKQRVLDLFPRLKERIAQKAGTLSGGEQQMLAVGRALMGSPTLLLLDEPSMGLAPVLVDLIFDTIQTIRLPARVRRPEARGPGFRPGQGRRDRARLHGRLTRSWRLAAHPRHHAGSAWRNCRCRG
jgi:branched-chain amino acid transport system ATP-binding protein